MPRPDACDRTSRPVGLTTWARRLTLTLALAGCAAPSSLEVPIASLAPAERAPGERLTVAATTSIVADVVGRVGGDDVRVIPVLPAGADPHSFEPSPRQLEALMDVAALFAAGLGLETPLEQALARVGVAAPIVALSEGLEVDDPHVWLDPVHVRLWIDNAARALSRLDPERVDAYRARASAYAQDVEALDRELQAIAAEIPVERRAVVADHLALSHLARRYGFEIVGHLIPSATSAAEPSARQLADLYRQMQARGVTVILVGSPESRSLADRVAGDTGARVVELYVESLSEASGPAGSYLNLMRYNLEAIAAALIP